MADSLRDQLVKAGLASGAQAKKAERQTRAEKNAQRSGGKHGALQEDPNSPERVKARALKQQAEKRARDQALARDSNAKSAAKALRAEIKQIISQNDLRAKTVNDDDVSYNFVHRKKIKKIFAPREQIELLSTGSLVIVNNDGLYHLLSKEVAEQIRSRDPKRIIASHDNRAPEHGSDDEHYAKFEVPDDLDW